MKKLGIAITIMFMSIGFAANNTTLSINGSTGLANSFEAFDVYYSDVVIDGTQDMNALENATTLTFFPNILNGDYEIRYNVTNNAATTPFSVSVNCNKNTSNVEIVNTFDSTTPLDPKETRTGTIQVKNHYQAQEVKFDNELFNIIDITDDTVTMLAAYNIGPDYLQTTEDHGVKFSSSYGWTWYPGPQEIDLQTWGGDTKVYVNNYVDNLKIITGEQNITGDLITMTQLKGLGCKIKDNYDYDYSVSCAQAWSSEWLVRGQRFRTRSASTGSPRNIWLVGATGSLSYSYNTSLEGVRPLITIPKSLLNTSPITCTIEEIPVQE